MDCEKKRHVRARGHSAWARPGMRAWGGELVDVADDGFAALRVVPRYAVTGQCARHRQKEDNEWGHRMLHNGLFLTAPRDLMVHV